jgi:4-carboxymuconolactone decarboxylase
MKGLDRPVPQETATEMFEQVNTFPPSPTKNVYRTAAIELIFAQVWTRPGLTRRQRRWVSLTSAGMNGGQVGCNAHVYGALNSGDISLAEMGEFMLHFAVYAGWPKATNLDTTVEQALARIASEGGEVPSRDYTPLAATTLEDLAGPGRETRSAVLGSAAGPARQGTPLSDVLASGLQYGQAWSRPQLARADRRLITITCLANQGHAAELRAHVAAALESGDHSVAALREVALHAGLYSGVMVGQAIDDAISEVTAG